MFHSHHFRPALVLLIGCVLAASLAAQDQVIPLKNWAAPLYWQPSPREEQKAARAAGLEPQLQLGAGAITPPLVFVGMAPCRVMDTRSGSGQTGNFGPPSMAGGSTRTVPIPTHPTCGIPATAQAYSLNVTVVPPPGVAMWFLTIWPTGQGQPGVSTLNDGFGQVLANAAIVPAGTSGSVNIFVLNTTDVILDINGYYASPTDLLSNTALGNGALANNTTGSDNTASGVNALQSNTTGSYNTASGFYALWHNTTGSDNTASGVNALQSNTTGSDNTASGFGALWNNTTGNANTASGEEALLSNTTGYDNTASGLDALLSNTTGYDNTASGFAALVINTTGVNNTASGYFALFNNTTGSFNTAIGNRAGYYLTTGSYNIHIGNQGVGGESATTRIGDGSQTRTFISGIRGVTTGSSNAVAVMVDSNGQLGTVNSSRTVKRDIQDMGDTTGTIMGLRPVRFRYTAHGPDSPEQYGLVAEEVAEVAPGLVARNKDGEIETVYYDKVYAMMLNQVQTQQGLIESQKAEMQSQEVQLQAQGDLIRQLESRLSELESRVK